MQITFAHGLIRATYSTPYNKTAAQFSNMENKKNKKTNTRKSVFFKKVNATLFTVHDTNGQIHERWGMGRDETGQGGQNAL